MRALGIALWGLLVLTSHAHASESDGASCSAPPASSSSGGSSGGSSDGFSDHAGDDGPPPKPACVDGSPIVGVARCRKAFSWDASEARRFTLELEVGGSRLDPAGVEARRRSARHDENIYEYRLVGDDVPRVSAFTLALRSTFFVAHGLYLGAGIEASLGVSSIDSSVAAGELEVTVDGVDALGGFLVAGFSIPWGSLAIRPELLAGVRSLRVHGETRHGDCITGFVHATRQWTLRARVVVDAFTTPRGTLGLFVGVEPLRREVAAGFRFAFHRRSYDGAFDD